MPLVMAKKEVRGTFRRHIRDKTGAVVDVLEFPALEPVEVPWEKLSAIRNDFYHALLPVAVGPTGKVTVIEREVFDAVVKEHFELAAMEAETAPESSEENGTPTVRRPRK